MNTFCLEIVLLSYSAHCSHSSNRRKPSVEHTEAMRCGQSCSAHLQTRITSRCPTTCLYRDRARLFPSTPKSIHPPKHAQPPCWQWQAFSQTINCVISMKTRRVIREGGFHWSFPERHFEAEDDKSLGSNVSLSSLCSVKGLVLLL